MDTILNLLAGANGKSIIEGISSQTGATESQTKAVAAAALPALLGALQNNASDGQGANGILNAIGSKHDGSILDNLSGFLGAGDTSDGNGILGHLLGVKRGALEEGIGTKTGVSSAMVSKIIALLAPIVMGYLGKQSRSTNVNDGKGLNDLLGGLLGGQSGGNSLGGLLDQNGDGKFGIDDAAGLLGGFFGKK